MQQWEYQSTEVKIDHTWSDDFKHEEIEEHCNQGGKEGWELVSVVRSSNAPVHKGCILFWKRPVA